MPQDYKKFEQTVAACVERHGVVLFAYCLMPNHIHLLARASQEPIAKFMHRLSTTYSHWWNAKYEQVGHVFQGRYRDTLCDEQAYLHALIRYVHLNPVRATLAKTATDWMWSSVHAYVTQPVSWVATETALALLDENRDEALKKFVSWLEREGPALDLSGRTLGSKSFLDRLNVPVASPAMPAAEDPGPAGIPVPTAEELIPLFCRLAKLRPKSLVGHSRRPTEVFMRVVVVEAMVKWWGWSEREIARVLKKSPAGVSKMRRRAGWDRALIRRHLLAWEHLLRDGAGETPPAGRPAGP